MIEEHGNIVTGGAGTGLAAYLRQLAATTPGMVYCVAHDSTDDDARAFAAEIEKRRLPVVVVSSWEVYPLGIDEVIYENSRVSPDTPYGHLCTAAERIIGEAARRAKVACAVLRPGMMFGTDIGGEGESMFREVLANRWFGIRQRPALRTLVCALDVARVALALIGHDGVWNVGDGRKSPLTDLAAAMSANSGYWKRPLVFPLPVARIIACLADALPFVNNAWGRRALQAKLTDRLLDTSSLAAELPDLTFYDTLAVIARTDPDYPYADK